MDSVASSCVSVQRKAVGDTSVWVTDRGSFCEAALRGLRREGRGGTAAETRGVPAGRLGAEAGEALRAHPSPSLGNFLSSIGEV